MPNELEDLEPGKTKGKDHTKYILVAVGILTVALGYMTYRRMSSGGQQQATSQPIDPNTGQVAGSAADIAALTGGSNTALGSTSPDFSTLTTSLDQLAANEQQLVSVLTPPPASATAAVAPSYTDVSTETMAGGGYNPPSGYAIGAPITTPGGSFSWIPSIPIAESLINSGQAIYTQPLPGDFVAASDPSKVTPGTALYTQISPAKQGIPAPKAA